MKVFITVCCALVACADEQNLGLIDHATTKSWAMALPNGGENRGVSVAIDSDGSVLALGDTNMGPIDLGSGPKGAAGILGYLTKRSAKDGSELWSVVFAGDVPNAFGDGGSVAVDGDGAAIVTGGYQGVVDFGGKAIGLDPPWLNAGTFLAKYDAKGQLAWVDDLHTIMGQVAVAVGEDGTIFVAGAYFAGPADGTGYLMAFDGGGNALWSKQFNGAAISSIAAVSGGGFVVTGGVQAPVSFGGPVLSPANYRSAFVASFQQDGTYVTSRTLGPPPPAINNGVEVVSIPSGLSITEVFDDQGYAQSIHAVSEDGIEQWSASIAADHGSVAPQLRAMTTFPDDTTASIAWVDGPYSPSHPEQSTGHMEVALFDQMGERTTSTFGQRMVGSPYATMVRGAFAAPNGKLAIIGDFTGQLDFGYGPMAAGPDLVASEAMFIVMVDIPSSQPIEREPRHSPH